MEIKTYTVPLSKDELILICTQRAKVKIPKWVVALLFVTIAAFGYARWWAPLSDTAKIVIMCICVAPWVVYVLKLRKKQRERAEEVAKQYLENQD